MVKIVEELCYNYRRCNCNRGGYVESSEEISSKGSKVGMDLLSEEEQIEGVLPRINTTSDAEGDEHDRKFGLQQLPAGYYTNSVTTVNNDARRSSHQIVVPLNSG